MKFININNKKAWIVCGVSLIIAQISFVFLPNKIPIHFNDGKPDDYSGKIQIFLFPLLQAVILCISEIKAVKSWSLNSKPKTEDQYYLILFGLMVLLMLIEMGIIAVSIF